MLFKIKKFFIYNFISALNFISLLLWFIAINNGVLYFSFFVASVLKCNHFLKHSITNINLYYYLSIIIELH